MYNIQNEKKMQFGNVSLFAVSKRIFVCTFTKHLYPIQSISKARAAHTSSARLKTREERRTHTIKYCILHGFMRHMRYMLCTRDKKIHARLWSISSFYISSDPFTWIYCEFSRNYYIIGIFLSFVLSYLILKIIV